MSRFISLSSTSRMVATSDLPLLPPVVEDGLHLGLGRLDGLLGGHLALGGGSEHPGDEVLIEDVHDGSVVVARLAEVCAPVRRVGKKGIGVGGLGPVIVADRLGEIGYRSGKRRQIVEA